MAQLPQLKQALTEARSKLQGTEITYANLHSSITDTSENVKKVLSGSSTPIHPTDIPPAHIELCKIKITDVGNCSTESKAKTTNWINQLALFFKEHHQQNTGRFLKDPEKILYAMHHAEGSVAEWLELYMHDKVQFKSYDNFKVQFLCLFGSVLKELDADAVVAKLCIF